MNLTLVSGLLLSLVLSYSPRPLFVKLTALYWTFWSLIALDLFPVFPESTVSWSQLLEISLTYNLDGLSKLFLSLVSFLGIFIFLYSSIYLENEAIQKKKKLFSLLQLFAMSMLFLLISDNLITLFLGWELTSVSSYLLIQFVITDKEANQAAFNTFFISILGSLLMLVGFILCNELTDTWNAHNAISYMQKLDANALFYPALFIILGAITKSAQGPFYFWLPDAMKAPAPVSAYLHSATLVNAGIYLLARFHPAFAPLNIWYPIIASIGLSTMVISSILSLFQQNLKKLLAYTTLFSLGSMVYLLASSSWLAAEAMLILLLFHGIYKAGAFMIAGTIEKEHETLSLHKLSGITKGNNLFAFSAIIIFGSMAGIPPLFGFVVKEILFEAKLAHESLQTFTGMLSIFSSILVSAASIRVLYYLFRTGKVSCPKKRSLPLGYLLPTLLAIMILFYNSLFPLKSSWIQNATKVIVQQSAAITLPTIGQSELYSILTFIGGAIVFSLFLYSKEKIPRWPQLLEPRFLFESTLNYLLRFASLFTKKTQNNSLTNHTTILFFSLSCLLLYVMNAEKVWYKSLNSFSTNSLQIFISLVLVSSSFSLIIVKNFIFNMISLAIIGLTISFFFISQGAVDVAMTQVLIEVLSIVILVVALEKSPPTYLLYRTKRKKVADLVVSLIPAFCIATLLTFIRQAPFDNYLNEFYFTNSLSQAFGKNVVNVILVDFRAFDTLGEALVLFATAISVWLIKETLIKGKQACQ